MSIVQETGLDSQTRILLIEDNEPNRRLMEDYLIYCGFNVLGLADGEAFEAAMVEFKPQAVLLDIKLPNINGYMLLKQMQQRSDWQKVPAIVVSACAFRADQQQAMDLGARRYLVKPIRLADLLQVIREELGNAV